MSSSIASAVLESGKALLIGNALDSDRFGQSPNVRRLALRSVLCAPLISRAEAFALIYIENRDVARKFNDRHRELLDEICSFAAARLRVAIAVESAKRRARELENGIGEADGILTADPQMASILETVKQVAATDLPVLIQGETGRTHSARSLQAKHAVERSIRRSELQRNNTENDDRLEPRAH